MAKKSFTFSNCSAGIVVSRVADDKTCICLNKCTIFHHATTRKSARPIRRYFPIFDKICQGFISAVDGFSSSLVANISQYVLR